MDARGTWEAKVKDFLGTNPDRCYVNKEVFYKCYYKIRPLLDIDLLYPLLMRHGIAKNSEDIERLTSAFHQPQDRHSALLGLTEKGGEYGFMVLYMCICETSEDSPGHIEAAQMLDIEGKHKCLIIAAVHGYILLVHSCCPHLFCYQLLKHKTMCM